MYNVAYVVVLPFYFTNKLIPFLKLLSFVKVC